MDERLQKLNEKAKGLPKAPGVYLMKDDKGRVIYVGKSASLRDRVSSYFQASTKLEHKKAGLLDLVVDFEVIQTDSEVEALLAENRLIKDIQPRYNASLRDDKTYPYLMITTGEDFPGVYITRQPRTSGVKLYGPFTSVYALKEAMTLLQKAFKFRTCHLEIDDADHSRRFFRPCLLYPIKQCTAPCGAKVSKEAYREDIARLIRFLDGDKKSVLRSLEKEMIDASKDMNFEQAAKLRDEIKALNALGARGKKADQEYWQPESFVTNPREGLAALQDVLGLPEPPRIVEAIDIAHLQGGEMVGSKVCFIDGVPFKDGYRRYKIKHGQGNNDYLSIQEVVSRRYREAGTNNELYPDVILIDGGLGQLHAALDVFKQMDVKPPMVISLAKKEELVYVQAKAEPIRLPRNNLGLKLLQYARDEAHRFAQHYHHILRRKSTLEEDVKSGRRPPPRGKVARKAAPSKTEDGKQPGEMPFSTHVGLPVLQPGGVDAQAEVGAAELLDPEDLPTDAPVTAISADLPPRSKMRADRGVQGTHTAPPAPAEE
ncbi:MAG: Excinuclease ABC subunit C [uncultured Phycisphaerae bacterium]|uniref:Excinuclease ABC subunit C n=1 Tax=uncultured Phycisphaerae bacterium TaxID=904963 RepID=A0A6J4Q2A1_9BACT|nr:MAG: Excinuclease ABC subunit C [uncultured Phycisphaerae bacterium]